MIKKISNELNILNQSEAVIISEWVENFSSQGKIKAYKGEKALHS